MPLSPDRSSFHLPQPRRDLGGAFSLRTLLYNNRRVIELAIGKIAKPKTERSDEENRHAKNNFFFHIFIDSGR